MEKKILIPTNFSKHAWNALIYGLSVYKKQPCTFYLFNSYSTQGFLGENIAILKDDQEENPETRSRKGLERILNGLSFRKENSKHNFEMISHRGSLAEGLQEAVDSKGIDLIIMGAAGDSAGINSASTTSVSRILDHVENVPFLVIPETEQFEVTERKEIVFPTNFRNSYKLRELQSIIDLAEFFNAAIRVLYINTDNKKLTEEQEINRENLGNLLQGSNYSFHTLTRTSPSTGVHLFIESRESSLLALYKRKQGFFSKLFNQAAAIDEVDFNTKVPILVLKEID